MFEWGCLKATGDTGGIETPDSAGDNGAAMCYNPILPGGFPDPCVCHVGDDYYLVNSSFEYFPGIPIHHSKDLVNWEWIGYGLHREEQVDVGGINLIDVKSEDGIQAPSLRHHNGTFYIVGCCVYRPPGSEDGTTTNFILTATDIRGPWSQPHIIEGAPGIDPDIFFDDDGKVWYVGTHAPEKPEWGGQGMLYVNELDLETFKLKGERHNLWSGALIGGVFIEGPRVYKHEGMYYLMAAEGGTGVNHCEVIAQSDKITGPYVPNERNPLITSRNLSYANWVHSTGHGDLVRLPDGRWYMVLLGIRSEQGRGEDYGSNMGRETFLVPVIWQRELLEWSPIGPPMKHLWPVAAPDTGRVEKQLKLPFQGSKKPPPFRFVDEFSSATLSPEWNFRRAPRPHTYSLTAKPGRLRLFASPEVMKERTACSLIGIRQRESNFVFRVRMSFTLPDNCTNVEAGISLFQKDDNYLNVLLGRDPASRGWQAIPTVAEKGGKVRRLPPVPLVNYEGEAELVAESDDHGYRILIVVGRTTSEVTVANPGLLTSNGYTGAYMGVYCTSNGVKADPTLHFADFSYAEQVAARRLVPAQTPL